MDTLSLMANVLPSVLDAAMPAQAGGVAEKGRSAGESRASQERDEAQSWSDVFSGVVDAIQFAQTTPVTVAAPAAHAHEHEYAAQAGLLHAAHHPQLEQGSAQRVIHLPAHSNGEPVRGGESAKGLPVSAAPASVQPQTKAQGQGQGLLLDVLEQGRLGGEVKSFVLQALAGPPGGLDIKRVLASDSNGVAAGRTGGDFDWGLDNTPQFADSLTFAGGMGADSAGAQAGDMGADSEAAYTAQSAFDLMPTGELNATGALGFSSTLSSLEARGADLAVATSGVADFSWVQDIQQQMDLARLKDESSLRLDVMLAGDQRLALQAQLQEGVLKLTFDANSTLISSLQADQLEALKAAMMENAPEIREVQFEQAADLPGQGQSTSGQSGRGEGRRERDSSQDADKAQRAGFDRADKSVGTELAAKRGSGLGLLDPDAGGVDGRRVSLRA
jgi:hypothetical protein